MGRPRFGRARSLAGPLSIALALVLSGCAREPVPNGASPAENGGFTRGTLVINTGEEEVLLRVEIAETSEQRQRGLMFREDLPEDAGMVFLPAAPTRGAFWMKNTLIPLSVAFWDQAGEIQMILDMEPCRRDPCPLYEPGVLWSGAVEVNEGFFRDHGVEVGDTVLLER